MTARAHDGNATLRATARAALMGTLLYAAVRFAAAYLDQYAFASAVVQAVLAEWGIGRLGVAWSDPLSPMPTPKEVAVRALRGGGMGLTAALVIFAVTLATRAAYLTPNTPSIVVALVGFVVPACLAVRDELLLRGLVLRVIPSDVPAPLRLLPCGLASAAAAYGEGATATPALIAATLGGIAFGTLWLGDRGAWRAWGAHAAFSWASGPLAKGGLVDLRATSGAWGGGDGGLGDGWAAVVALAIVCAAALGIHARKPPLPT